MNVFLIVVTGMLLVNAVMAAALVVDVRRVGRAARSRVTLSVVRAPAPASLTPPVRPALVVVK